jgi:hypothetical protein
MLHLMHDVKADAQSSTSAGFASLLCALSLPISSEADRDLDLNHECLADDVATISYERALHRQAPSRRSPANVEAVRPPSKSSGNPRPSVFSSGTAMGIIASNPGQGRKAASITIRLSKAECDQVRHRATEAGLTVSGYLRSCVLEAEILRAEVKEALTKFRELSSLDSNARPKPVRSGMFTWCALLLPLRAWKRRIPPA